MPDLFCEECLSFQQNAVTDSQSDSSHRIVADSQIAEDDLLWKRPNPRSRLFFALDEVVDASDPDESTTTPDSRKPKADEISSKPGTPFRNGLKGAVVASSILDVMGKSPRRQEKPKRNMVQSKNILSYFSPKRVAPS